MRRGQLYTHFDQLRGLEQFRDLLMCFETRVNFECVVDCGKCGAYALTGTTHFKNARNSAEREGWRYTRRGWTCPSCVAQMTAEPVQDVTTRQMPIEYGKWFYPHKGEIPVEDDGFPRVFSETVIASYDEGGVELPDEIAFVCYSYLDDTWSFDREPWCWMYYPPRTRK